MSCDSYRRCPVCNVDDAVPIRGLVDYGLLGDGSISIHIYGTCTMCGTEYDVNV